MHDEMGASDSMSTKRPDLLFGINIMPTAQGASTAFLLAGLADALHIDFIALQDHPYNAAFLDTWTLLSALGARTQRVRLLPDVLNLPLRPPAMLAKAAAALDILTREEQQVRICAKEVIPVVRSALGGGSAGACNQSSIYHCVRPA